MPLTSASTLVGFPDAKSTGLPDGVTLTASGDVNVTKAGTVIDALDVKGTIWVMAPNVTIQNSRITSTEWTGIWIKPGITGTVVKDNEILNVGSSKDGANGIFGSGTFLRNDIHDVENGINVTGSSLIQDNYIHDMHAPNVRVGTVWGGPHYDGIEINGGVSGVDIRHNTIINENGQTSAVMINNDFGPVSDIQVDGNYLAGGGYTLYSDGSFSSTDKISGVEFTNNELGQGYWGYYYFKGNTPVLSNNDEIGREWPTPVSSGDTPTPEPAPTIAMFSTDSGTLGDGLTNDNTLTLSGTAAANSTVKVLEGTTQVGQATADGSGTWSYTTVALADGSHSFTATATSGGTTSAASSPLTVRVDTVAPSAPTIASFSMDTGTVGDGITSDNTLTLNGAAAANSTVKLYDGSMLLGTETANGSGAWSYTTGVLSNAPHSLTATATDAAGNISVASAVLAVTVNTVGTGVPTTLTGTSGNDVLPGTSGADVMTGLAGNDTYTVNNSGDQVVELANQGADKVESTISYTLADNVESLQLMGGASISGTGNSLNNTIIGNDVSNTLKGNAGNDTLNGWGGKDTLIGDSGSDVFQFSSQFSADGDKVMDFVHGVDKLDFSKIDARTSRSGDQAFIFDGYEDSGSNGHLWAVEDQAAGVTHVYGMTGNFQFHIDLQGVHIDLTSSDFIL